MSYLNENFKMGEKSLIIIKNITKSNTIQKWSDIIWDVFQKLNIEWACVWVKSHVILDAYSTGFKILIHLKQKFIENVQETS